MLQKNNVLLRKGKNFLERVGLLFICVKNFTSARLPAAPKSHFPTTQQHCGDSFPTPANSMPQGAAAPGGVEFDSQTARRYRGLCLMRWQRRPRQQGRQEEGMWIPIRGPDSTSQGGFCTTHQVHLQHRKKVMILELKKKT